MEVADLKKSSRWLERAGLKDGAEALILAARGAGPEHQSHRGTDVLHQTRSAGRNANSLGIPIGVSWEHKDVLWVSIGVSFFLNLVICL